MNGAEIVKLILSFLIPLVAVFFGAWAAFLLENWRRKRKEKDEQYRAIRFAHLIVVSQYNDLIHLQRRRFKEWRNHNAAWKLPLSPLGHSYPNLNVSELAFVLEGQDPDLLNRLIIGQHQYESIRSIIAWRHEVHLQVQRHAADKLVDDKLDNVGLLGKDLVAQLKDMTASLLKDHERAILVLEKNLSDITKFVQEDFPDRRAPEFDLVSEGEEQ